MFTGITHWSGVGIGIDAVNELASVRHSSWTQRHGHSAWYQRHLQKSQSGLETVGLSTFGIFKDSAGSSNMDISHWVITSL